MTKGEGQGIQRDDAIGHHEEAESIFSLSLESISNPPNPSSRGHISDLSYLLCYSGVRPAPAAAKSLQSCPTLCDPTDGSPPGSSVAGILQARTLEWVAISFSKILVYKTSKSGIFSNFIFSSMC